MSGKSSKPDTKSTKPEPTDEDDLKATEVDEDADAEAEADEENDDSVVVDLPGENPSPSQTSPADQPVTAPDGRVL